MKKTITKVLAIIGAIAAIAALLFVFRDKIKALLEKYRCNRGAEDTSDLEGSVEAAIEKAEETVEDFVEEVREDAEQAAEAAKEKAEAIIEEFKDYADVEPEDVPTAPAE